MWRGRCFTFDFVFHVTYYLRLEKVHALILRYDYLKIILIIVIIKRTIKFSSWLHSLFQTNRWCFFRWVLWIIPILIFLLPLWSHLTTNVTIATLYLQIMHLSYHVFFGKNDDEIYKDLLHCVVLEEKIMQMKH